MRKTYALYKKTLVLLLGRHPKLVVFNIFHSIISAVLPYVNIGLSAKIIDELAYKRLRTLIQSVLALTVCNLLFRMLSSFIEKVLAIESGKFITTQMRLVSEKSALVSYEVFISESFQNQKRKIDELSEENGTDLSSIIDIANRFIVCVVSIVSAAVTLCFAKVNYVRARFVDVMILFIAALLIVGLLFVSILKLHKIYHHKKKFNVQILPCYKINWYLDKEYLRFNKTAKEVRIFNQDGIISKLIGDANSEIYQKKKAYEKNAGKTAVIVQASKYVSNYLIYIFVGVFGIKGVITIGDYTRITSVFRNLYDNIINLGKIVIENSNAILWLDAFWEHLEYSGNTGYGNIDPDRNYENKAIVVDGIDFSYGTKNNDFKICNLNLSIEKSEHVAIVGQNGSGKSTLIMLICGLLSPQKGKIYVNGTNRIGRNDFDGISTTFQDFSLLALLLRENISVSCESNKEKVLESMHKAGLPKCFEDLLDNYLFKQIDANGIEVSGGEKQKIAIARALYKDEPVMIMDEPTSSLDPISESVIYENIHNDLRDKTVLFISHRLSSCKFCDRILVMEDGKIIQQGTHDELLKNSTGKYASLWNAQAKYYQIQE